MTQNNTLFEDKIIINSLDKDGKVFDKITRIEGKSVDNDCKIILDVNTDVYKINKDSIYSILLTKSLFNDISTSNKFDFDVYLKKNSLMDRYDYVMNGKIFKLTEEPEAQVTIYVSFGGLLLGITGDPMHLSSLNLDDKIYLLMKKVE